MNKVQILKAIDGKVSTAKFASLKAKQLPYLVEFYQGLLIDLLPIDLGIPNVVAKTLSIERLSVLINDFQIVEKEILTDEITLNKGGKRQKAMRDLVAHHGVDLFPIDVKALKDIMHGFYAFAYFDLNGIQPLNKKGVMSLYKSGMITITNGVDENTVFAQLKKNSEFAVSNAYSTSHKLGTHKAPHLFPFVLTCTNKVVSIEMKST